MITSLIMSASTERYQPLLYFSWRNSLGIHIAPFRANIARGGACFTLEGSEVGWDRRRLGVCASAVWAVEGGGVWAGQQSAVHRAALSVTNVPTVCVTGLSG